MQLSTLYWVSDEGVRQRLQGFPLYIKSKEISSELPTSKNFEILKVHFVEDSKTCNLSREKGKNHPLLAAVIVYSKAIDYLKIISLIQSLHRVLSGVVRR